MKSPLRPWSLSPLLFRILGLIVLSPLTVDFLPAQGPEDVPSAAASDVRKRAPLLLAEQAMANVPEETKRKLAAKAVGRPPIPKGKRRYLVHLRDEIDPAAFAKGRGIACERTFIHVLKGFVACLDDAAVDALRDAGEVLGIEEDRPTSEVASQTIPTGVKRMAVAQFPAAKINGLDERVDVDVAVLEYGAQPDHPDLNVYRTHSNWGAFTISDHGTAVAGVIGALDNEYGTVGVAPGVRIWSVSGIQYTSDTFAGFEYVADHADEIEVLNCSFGPASWGLDLRNSWQEAIGNLVNKGVVVVCGAGNNSRDIAGLNGVLDDGDASDNYFPAALPESMAVSAVSPTFDQFATYSNYSGSHHNQRKVFSPGGAIDIAAPTDAFAPLMNSSYGFLNGTSCATPHVSGLVALYIAKHGRATDAAGVYRIRQAIVDAAQPQSRWQADDTLDPDSYPEGLAVASSAWLDPAPKVTRIEKLPDRVEVETTTLPGYSHALEESPDLGLTAVWNRGDAITGTGAPATFIHQPTDSRNFYRLATSTIPWQSINPVLEPNLGCIGTPGDGRLHLITRLAGDALASEPSGKSLSHVLADLGGTGGMKVPWLSGFSPVGSFSMEIWVKPARNTATYLYSPRFAGTRENGGRGWSLNQYPSVNTSNPNGFTFTVATGGTSSIAPSFSTVVDVNKWYHIVGVFDGANALLYVDGSLSQSVSLPSGQSYLPPLETGICLGSQFGNRHFDGRMDEVAFYPHTLTAAQVLAHYHAGINPAPPVPYPQVILADNPAGYWRFNEP